MAIETYYDKKSLSYDSAFDILYFEIYDTITWRHLEPYVPSSPEAKVLDAGGGTGRWSIRMAKKGCKVILLDISEGMLNVAKEKIEREGLQHRITIEKGDITKLKYPDETFDMILCEHTLFLLEDPDAAIKEFARALKKGAPLIVSAQNLYVQSLVHLPCTGIPTPEKLDEVLNILLRKRYNTMTKNGKVKIYTWTPDEFRNLLERNGLRVQKIIGKGTTMPLRIAEELYMKREYSKDILNKILQLELILCEKPDALALAGHLQAIAYKP
jgi:ubiquinone/menaquinone biosynthesis C-methylase UbiE